MQSILEFLQDPTVRRYIVTAGYFFHTSAFFGIIYVGYKHKSYGMPPFATAAALGFATICGFYGPWQSDYSYLFFSPEQSNFDFLVNLWRFWALMCLIVLYQYFRWAKNNKNIWSNLKEYKLPGYLNSTVLFLLMIALFILGDWYFIVFFQDYYVNVISPFVMFFVAIGYLGTLFIRPKLLGLSLYVAWAWFIGNLLLYGGTVLGPMDDPYRNFHHGYDFIYWLYIVTLLLNFAYAYLLSKRREELQADFHKNTPERAPMLRAAMELQART